MKTECENFSPKEKPAFPCGHCSKMVPGCSDSCPAFARARERLLEARGGCDSCEYWRGDGTCDWRPLAAEVDALADRLSRLHRAGD